MKLVNTGVCCFCKQKTQCYMKSHPKIKKIIVWYKQLIGSDPPGTSFCGTCGDQLYNELHKEKETRKLYEKRAQIPNFLQTDNTNSSFSCIEIGKNTSEFKKIAEIFKKTLDNEIIRIEKCHNPKLLAKFERKMQTIKGDQKIRYLFHGSGNQNYDKILSNGFDLSFAKDTGSLGAGIYFAEHASYSNMCTRHLETKEIGRIKNMLCCRVVYGVTGTDTRFGSNICAVFSESQCYPEYIIYYSLAEDTSI